MLVRKRAFALILAFILSFSFALGVFAAKPVFQDLQNNHYSEEIELVTDLGFIFYYDKPYFAPNMIVTRDIAAETMYILVNGSLNEAEGIDYSTSIPDVRVSDFPVYYCRDTGIAIGFDDGTFRPNDPVTYGQFIKMLISSLGIDEEQALAYPDDYLSLAELNGITVGLDFSESDLLTNEPAALMVYNSLNIPRFGDEGNQTLLETTFKDLKKTTQDLNSIIADIESTLASAEGSSVNLKIKELNDKFYVMYGYYSDVFDNNINAAYKYDLKIDKFYDVSELIEQAADLEDEIQALFNGEVRGDRWEVESVWEELMSWESLDGYYFQSAGQEEYASLLENLITRQRELIEQKLELLKASLPTEEDLLKGIEEMEEWLRESLYGEPVEKSETGLVFESVYDFMELVEATYWELYYVYSDLYSEEIITDESYEERMDELYYLITGSRYMDLMKEYQEEGWDNDFEPAEMIQYAIEMLQEMEYIHYPEQAEHLIDKLTEAYLKEVE